MACSMTGIGEGRFIENGFDINVLIRSVNHRFLSMQIRLPRGYQRYEMIVREIVSRLVNRGKIDINIDFLSLPPSIGDVVFNEGYGVKLCALIRETSQRLNIPDGLTVERLMRFNDMVSVLPDTDHDESLKNAMLSALEMAMEEFMASRRKEGGQLAKDLNARAARLLEAREKLGVLAQTQPALIRDNLRKAIERLSGSFEVDAKRMEEEVLIWAVKSDITEELTRLRIHLNRISSLLESEQVMGKELEFLIQELHREVTTIGTKSVVPEINQLVVTGKIEIEKMREQVQNLE